MGNGFFKVICGRDISRGALFLGNNDPRGLYFYNVAESNRKILKKCTPSLIGISVTLLSCILNKNYFGTGFHESATCYPVGWGLFYFYIKILD